MCRWSARRAMLRMAADDVDRFVVVKRVIAGIYAITAAEAFCTFVDPYPLSMNAAQSFKIYELLNDQFQQPERARQLTEAIESVIDEKVDKGNTTLESSLKKDLEILRSDVVGTLRTEMKEQKSEMIKWMFVFWVSQFAASVGIILLILRK